MKIGLLGNGVVGGGVLEICDKREDICVKYVLVRRPKPELGERAVSDISVILNDPEIDTVVEVMGGLSPAFEYVSAALRAGKNVVTANKHLVAHYYGELISLARENGCAFRCTPAVGGGIPWLVNLERVMRLDKVKSFCGIMNGTTNFILDAMHTLGADFGDVLKQAQELGYAEADPSADIDGLDVQRKCIITANVAFGACMSEADVPVKGIRDVAACDIAAAVSMGCVCRLMAFGKTCEGAAPAVFVEPCFVPAGDLMAAVATNRNAISFDTELTGVESFYGQGAGRYPTAYNAVADCLDIMSGVKKFYNEEMGDVKSDNTWDKHAYYVRASGFPEELTDCVCGEGVISVPMSVADMHAWAKDRAGVFFAAIV